jgi:hypothetical protein
MIYQEYDSPEEVKTIIKKYFDWCKTATDYVSVTKHTAKRVPHVPTPSGVCLTLNISPSTYKKMSSGDMGQDFADVIEWARTYIKEVLLSGAACGQYVASFVDRMLQNNDDPEWVDRKIVKNEGGDSDYSKLKDDELESLIEDMQKTVAERKKGVKLKVVDGKKA